VCLWDRSNFSTLETNPLGRMWILQLRNCLSLQWNPRTKWPAWSLWWGDPEFRLTESLVPLSTLPIMFSNLLQGKDWIIFFLEWCLSYFALCFYSKYLTLDKEWRKRYIHSEFWRLKFETLRLGASCQPLGRAFRLHHNMADGIMDRERERWGRSHGKNFKNKIQ
jgi:hypothetical protein